MGEVVVSVLVSSFLLSSLLEVSSVGLLSVFVEPSVGGVVGKEPVLDPSPVQFGNEVHRTRNGILSQIYGTVHIEHETLHRYDLTIAIASARAALAPLLYMHAAG